jgi:DNA-binding transcriptional LysR family regulator
MNLLGRMSTFVRVVEAGSLSRAAKRERISVPAISRQLVTLERELGAKLAIRTTRSMKLTEAGRNFYERALRVLREAEDAVASVKGDPFAGRLVVTAPVTFGLMCINPLLPAFFGSYPQLELELRLEDRFADLVGDGVDIALRAGIAPPESNAMIARELGSWTRVLVAAPKYLRAHKKPKHPTELAKHEALIQLPGGGDANLWSFRDSAGQEIRINVRGPFRTNALLALREAAKDGLGIARLPHWLVGDALRDKELEQLLPDFDGGNTTIYALYRIEHRASARIRAFLEHLTRGTGATTWRSPGAPRR